MSKVLVIYDSLYGNTEKIAIKISKSIKASKLLHLGKVKQKDIKDSDLIIIGSPTQGGSPTSDMTYFLTNTPELKDKSVAVFDTRFDVKSMNFILRLTLRNLSYAAPVMAGILKDMGANLVNEPTGFFVGATDGPLKPGEIKKAQKWAKELTDS